MVVVLLLGVALLAACAAPEAEVVEVTRVVEKVVEKVVPTEEKVTLHYSGYLSWSELYEDNLFPAFMKHHPEVENIVLVPKVGSLEEQLAQTLNMAAAGTLPDTMMTTATTGMYTILSRAYIFIDIGPYIERENYDLSQHWKAGLDICEVDGVMHGLPMCCQPGEQMLYYNKKMFREAGVSVPKTWDEWIDVGKKLTKDTDGDGEIDQWGYYLMGAKDEGTICFIDSLLQSNDGWIVNEDGTKGMLDSPEVIEAMEFYMELVKIAPPGVASADQVGSSNYFTTGKVAMEGIGEWEQDTIKNRAPNMDWGVATMPAPRGKTFHPCLGGWSYVIFKDSPHHDAAWKFIEFASSEANNYKMAALTPAHVDAAPKFLEEFKVGPSVIFDHCSQGYPRPKVPVYPQISEIQRQMVQEMLMGKNVRQACIDANEEVNDLLAGK